MSYSKKVRATNHKNVKRGCKVFLRKVEDYAISYSIVLDSLFPNSFLFLLAKFVWCHSPCPSACPA